MHYFNLYGNHSVGLLVLKITGVVKKKVVCLKSMHDLLYPPVVLNCQVVSADAKIIELSVL